MHDDTNVRLEQARTLILKIKEDRSASVADREAALDALVAAARAARASLPPQAE